MRRLAYALSVLTGLGMASAPLPAQPADPRVIVVTVDGYRWQEFFGGADPAYFTRNSKGVIEAAAADYAGPTAEARRARLERGALGGMMAFIMWSVLGPVYDILGKLKL